MVLRRTPRPILISMSSRRHLLDAIGLRLWPGTRFVLHPSESRHTIPFVRAVADPRLWPVGAEVHIGRSVLDGFHPVALAAIANICARHTGKPVQLSTQLTEKDSLDAAHLADWLLTCAAAPSGSFPTEKQTSYLFTSGAHRARAIGSMLEAIGKTAVPHMVDIGTGVGLIPWLLCNGSVGSRSVQLFEPDRKRHVTLERLWAFRQPQQTYTVAPLRAENVPFSTPADLIMFCQCLFRIDSAQRRAVLEKAWQSLRPGGALFVNEMPKQAAGSDLLRDSLIPRDDIVSLMPGTPRLFTARTGWRTAQEPRAVSARSIGSSGLFVSIRPD